VKIVPDEGLVYFSYVYEPNELGRVFGYNKTKYRAKAKIIYDAFLEKYIFKGVMWSQWDREVWKNTQWVYEKKDKRVFTMGIK
jgi:hypothetical protein